MSKQAFAFYSTPHENSKVPCLVRRDVAGGDPHVLCTFGRIYNPDALHELCSLANSNTEANKALVDNAADLLFSAKEVMAKLDEFGGSIVPHLLLDTDTNAGQRLRDAIAKAEAA